MADKLEVIVHHGGGFEEFNHNGYVGANVSWFVDENYFSYFEFVGEIKKELKYPTVDTMWFYDPQDLDELVLLEDDMGTNRMCNIAKMDGRVHLYLMHPLGEPDIIDMIENGPAEGVNEYGPAELVNEYGPAEGVKEHEPTDCINDVEGNEGVNEGGSNRGVNQKRPIAEGVIEKEAVQATDKGKGVRIDDDVIDDLLNEVDYEEESEDSAIGIQFDDSEEECEQQIEQGDDLFEQRDVGARDKGKGKATYGGLSDVEDCNSDELHSGNDSEDEEQSNVKKDKFPTFKLLKDMRDYKWEVGTYFACKEEFQYAIKCYSIQSARAVKFKKNDKTRMRVICKPGCKWAAYCAHILGQETWQLRKIHDDHKFIVTTTPFQGDEDDLEHPERPLCPHFQRVYICLKGCRESFLRCRPIIGLDGAFLKGYYGGQLLAAIGRDPNDQMLPIAFAVVEGETKDTWSWFLKLLTNDLGGTRACSAITFISDQQKGLLPAIEELLPGVGQRFCVRHLYNNFRKKFPGKKLKELMWKAANATYANAWHRVMQ
ncbi:hypothetical protein QL285_022691 [Trifolium repens]|nr:hypothetical protein QL285_022691 [Trifolium repens]